MTTKPSRSPATATVHRLKVTLRGSKPPIWRRIVVPSDITLGDLHVILQDVMGWDNDHLHDFTIDGMSYADPDMVDDFDEDEHETRLADVVPNAGARFRYMYDFGDSWDHEILVEAVSAPEPGQTYPVCLTGRRAGPPDDVGGIWRYNHLGIGPGRPGPSGQQGDNGMAGRVVGSAARPGDVRLGSNQQAAGAGTVVRSQESGVETEDGQPPGAKGAARGRSAI